MHHCYFIKFFLISAATGEATGTTYQPFVADELESVLNESIRIVQDWADPKTVLVFKKVLSTAGMLEELEKLSVNIRLKHMGLCLQFFST